MSKIWDYKSNQDDKLSIQIDKTPDIAFTKDEMAKHLISIIEFKEGDIVMEPCYGKGSFYNNLPEYTNNIFCEINMDKDYLQFDGNSDITLSNPPFVPRKLFWEFHKKAMDTTNREIWWLINISSLNVFTPNRIIEMNEKGWYLNHLHITADKRWFGRYVWCQFTKTDLGILSFNKKVF